MKKRVAVIGAGASGLAALRHMSEKPEAFDPVAFEQSDVIGGTWVYSDSVGTDRNGRPIYSSVYKNLITNIPKPMMPFSGFPYPDDLPSFFRHEHVHQYLEDFTEHFGLRKFIRFNSKITQVFPNTKRDGEVEWLISIDDTSVEGESENDSFPTVVERFDAVIVAVGMFSIPRIPDISGMGLFQGTVIHSHDYRTPDEYTGKRVVVLGASISGQDISQEIATVATSVVLSHNKPRMKIPLTGNIRQAYGVVRLTPKHAITADGEEIELDVLMLCTGYKKCFPFLKPECRISVENGSRIFPLYKHILNAEFPTMCFIGFCLICVPFTLIECQIKFSLAAISGTFRLPSTEDMMADIHGDHERRLAAGMPSRYAHHLGERLQEYQNDLADLAKFQPPSENFYDVWGMVLSCVKAGQSYKNIEFKTTEDGKIDVQHLKRSLNRDGGYY